MYGQCVIEKIISNTSTQSEKVTLPRPWDLVDILRWDGVDGLRRRYYTLRPFAETCRLLGDASWAPGPDWYTSLTRVMALCALQAQWDECNSLEGKAWVASKFWTQDVAILRYLGSGGPGQEALRKHPAKSLDEYLDGPAFAEVVETLTYLARLQATADDLNGIPERRIGVGRRVAA